ncbi:MAG: HAD family hydrolase [Lachnospiraceae bacterium]|nr:HAD family hydrolase [Lachnospiraceae bacterium]
MAAKEKKKVILFDLDGTLTDPMIGITKSVQYALKKYGIIEEDLWNLTKFIGPPLKESFMEFYGFSEEEGQKAVEYYREYYAPVGIYENQVYEGLEKMLAALKEKGLSLCVATSKPERFAKMILDHFHLDSYFDLIGGALMDGRTDKAEVISYVLAQLDTKKEKVVMVGDREHDVLGARKNGLDSIGVLFGYGNEEELKEAGADWIAKDMTELGNLLLTLAE